jgi:hypothetical protein
MRCILLKYNYSLRKVLYENCALLRHLMANVLCDFPNHFSQGKTVWEVHLNTSRDRSEI